jgi:HEAT repeat protein
MFQMVRSLAAVLAFATFSLMAADMPADVAAQVAKFKDASPQVRQQAVAAVGRMGEKAKPALPELCKMLNDKTTWVVTKSLMAIKDIGPDEASCKAVAPVLGLSNEPEKRVLAADVFVASGEKGVPILIEALKDEHQAEGASEALVQMGAKGKGASDALKDVVAKHKSKPIRDKAAAALKAVNK